MNGVNNENDNNQQEPVIPSLPCRLCGQALWIDNLLSKPTWEKSVRTKPIYLTNFDWSRAFRKPLDGSETMNILAMRGPGGTKDVAQLWVIGKIEYATLVVTLFPSYTIKLCLTGDDCNNLRLMLKKWGNLGKDWDPASLKSVVNFSTRLDKVKELIQLITDDKEAQDVVRTMYFQDTFQFIYDVRRSANVSSNFLDPAHNVDDFMSNATVAVKYQILSRNFKASKKIDAVKAYLF